MRSWKYSTSVFIVLALVLVVQVSCTSRSPTKTPSTTDTSPPEKTSSEEFIFPLSSGMDRVTKKPFWLKISPADSPISPEKFSGYHTGVDFETLPLEQDETIIVHAICTGPLVMKKWATGYGGVAVQKCQRNQQDVTVIYGHLKLASIEAPLESILLSGQKLWVLGKGFSSETDNERKHLHLGIHLWSVINIRWYVNTPSELDQWLDSIKYLQ